MLNDDVSAIRNHCREEEVHGIEMNYYLDTGL